jgi:hypothetical protein
MPCCAGDSDTSMGRDEEEVLVEVAQELDEEFVFLEQYPTDKKVENPVCSTHRQNSKILACMLVMAYFTLTFKD